MATQSGYSNKKMKGRSRHVTVQPVGSDRIGVPAPQMYLSHLASALTILAISKSLDGNSLRIRLSGAHLARVEDQIRITSGNLDGFEVEIISVTAADTLDILNVGNVNGNDVLPQVGDSVDTLRWVTALSDPSGALQTSPGPLQYTRNAVTQEVTEDTAAPANNRVLPTGIYFFKDDVAIPVRKDTVTPANTSGVPVEIVAASGSPINITAGDLNVQISDAGANFDATRIGDGSGVYLDINPDGSINVLGPLTDAQLRASAVPVSMASAPLPTGAATEAKQDTQITELQDIEADVEALSAKFGTLGQKNMAGSAPVVIASDQSAIPVTGPLTDAQLRAAPVPVSAAALPLPTGAATEAKQDTQITELQDIEADIEAMSAKLPATLGQKTSANSLAVVLSSDQSAIAVTQSALTGSYQEDLTVTDGAVETFTAPAGAKWCKIQADDTNTGNLRVKIGAAATTTSGIQLQPGRSEDFQIAGDISYVMEAGATGKIYVQFGV